MKKRLGAIPKGLEWITDQSIDIVSQSVQQPKEVIEPLKYKQSAKTEEKKHIYTQHTSAAKRGLSEDLIRATFILRQDYLDKIKAYAYWERLQIKEVFDEMCDQFFKGKKVRSVPERKR